MKEGGTIAVTGATGFVGRHVVRAALERGWRIRALVRDGAKATRALPEGGVDLVFGDGLDHDSLRELAEGAEAFVHCIGIRRELPPDVTFARLHPGAASAAAAAAAAAGIGRFVLISALGTRAEAPTAYHQSKFESERLLRESGLGWTIIRPSLVHGAGGEFVEMVRDWVLGRAAPRFFLPYFARVEMEKGFPPKPPRFVSARVAPVHVEDVAECVCRSLERDEAIGEVYPLTGPQEMDWPELLGAIRDALPLGDKKKPIRPVPAPLALGVARAASAVGMGPALPFGPSEPVMATEDSVAPTTKARQQLGLQPVGFYEALRAYAPSL